jgi:hypothetical protein
MKTDTQPTARQQFIDDFLIVVENDFNAWSRITQMAESTHLFQFAQDLSDNYDDLIQVAISQVKDEFTSNLLREILNGWGMDTWIAIAKHIQERVEQDGN